MVPTNKIGFPSTVPLSQEASAGKHPKPKRLSCGKTLPYYQQACEINWVRALGDELAPGILAHHARRNPAGTGTFPRLPGACL